MAVVTVSPIPPPLGDAGTAEAMTAPCPADIIPLVLSQTFLHLSQRRNQQTYRYDNRKSREVDGELPQATCTCMRQTSLCTEGRSHSHNIRMSSLPLVVGVDQSGVEPESSGTRQFHLPVPVGHWALPSIWPLAPAEW